MFDVFGVGVCEHGDGIAEAVLVFAGPWEGAVRDGVGAGFIIDGVPPAAIDGVDEGGAGEAVGAV